jgi:hypothetical protein
MADMNLRLEVRVSQRVLRLGMTAAMLLAAAGDLASESVQLTTYYPAPSGVYTQLIGTSNTWLSRDAGTTTVGSATTLANTKLAVLGEAGIGTASPGAQLTVLNNDNGTENIVQVYPQNLTQGVGIGYNYIREIGSNGNNAMDIDAQGGGVLAMQTVGTGYVGIGTTGPATQLHVVSHSDTNWSALFQSGDASAYFADGAGYGAYIDAGSSANSGTYELFVNHSGNADLTVRGGGGVGVGLWPAYGSLDVGPGPSNTGMIILRQTGCYEQAYGAGVTNCAGGYYTSLAFGVYSYIWYLGNNAPSGTGTMACCPFGIGGAVF